MSKIMSKSKCLCLLILISIFTFTSTQSCNEETNPENPDVCYKYNGPNIHDDLCCYYESLDTSEKRCNLVPYSADLGYLEYDYIDNKLYKRECERSYKKEDSILTRCAENKINPYGVKTCKKFSRYVDSCCYFEGSTEFDVDFATPEKGCYWLGAKFEGNIKWGSLKLKCSSNYLNSYTRILIAFIMIFLI